MNEYIFSITSRNGDMKMYPDPKNDFNFRTLENNIVACGYSIILSIEDLASSKI